jgi:hypothetical protein
MNIDIIQSAATVYSGHVLKVYEPGGTTPISIAIDDTGGSPQATLTTNANGVFEVSGNEVLPFIDRSHKWALFANAADATNNTNPVLGFFDNVPFVDSGSIVYSGSTTVGQRLDTIQASSMQALLAIVSDLIDGQVCYLASFWPSWEGMPEVLSGGGMLVYDASLAKSNHNGITIISTTVPWSTSMPDFLTGVGETDGGGNGCWARTITSPVNIKWAGAKADGSTDDLDAINQAILFMNARRLGGTVTGGELYFPFGRYMVSGSVDFTSFQRCIVRGDGYGSQIYPSTTGYNTVKMVTTGANNTAVEMHQMNVFVQNNQIGLQWEYHQGGIFNCHVNPVSNPATGVTAIQLDQTAGNTGSWITKIRDCRIDFSQASTANNCTGIEAIGAANAVSITGNTIAGFNGTGLRIKQYVAGSDSQMILISDNDIESMTDPTQINIGVDVQGVATRISIKDNYFEGIEGAVASRFIRVGAITSIRALTFRDNYCLTDNPLPAGFIGVELMNAISPDIGRNYSAPPGAGVISLTANYSRTITNITQANPGVITVSTAHGYLTGATITVVDGGGMTQLDGRQFTVTVVDSTSFSINEDATLHTPYSTGGSVDTTFSTTMDLPNQICAPIKSERALLEITYATPQFNQVAGAWEDIGQAWEFVRMRDNGVRLWEFFIAYEPAVGTGETYSFRLMQNSGAAITDSVINDTPSGTGLVVISKLFAASINDLKKVQFSCDTAQTGPNEGASFKDIRVISYSE